MRRFSLGVLPLLACFLGSSARHNCNSACDLILGSKSLAHGSFRIMGSLPTITWRCQHELNCRVERARVEVGVMIPVFADGANGWYGLGDEYIRAVTQKSGSDAQRGILGNGNGGCKGRKIDSWN